MKNKVLYRKKQVINMPQMALAALSENWLFKELGDTHWAMICKGLQTPSFDLKNDTGDRLYATFVRIRISIEKSLQSFVENDATQIQGRIQRFGNSLYFSKITLKGKTASVNAELMTTFSIRHGSDNTQLAKSEPVPGVNLIENLAQFPKFGNDYRLTKKKKTIKVEHGLYQYEIDLLKPVLFQTDYVLNPYYDLNGVNLLYFAAYPIINDVCEARYFNEKYPNERWEQTYYTEFKDIFYHNNCNIQDIITYKMLSCESLTDGRFAILSALHRSSDGEIIAIIYTIKTRHK